MKCLRTIAVLAAFCLVTPAFAQTVELRGRIDAQMAEKVRTAVAAGVRDFVINTSNGGFVFVAYTIADLMRSNDASLTINGRCASACALLAIGVPHKRYTAEAEIEIHGARYTVRPPGAEDSVPARGAAAYMMYNGVPEAIATGPGMGINLHRLSTAELAQMGFEPAR